MSESSGSDSLSSEPLLKYHRVQGVVPQLLSDSVDGLGDKVSVALLHEHYLLIGTFDGAVLQLDREGKLIRRNQQHRDKITGLSTDLDGGVYASCSEDGRVVIYSAIGDGKVTVHNFHHPIRAIQLDPLFSKQRDNAFVCGGTAGKLMMKKKGWFSNADTEIHKGEGTISDISWQGDLIAWSNESGVKIYDYTLEQRIAYVERPPGSGIPCRCYLRWEDNQTLLIGWATSIKIVKIKQRKLLSDPNITHSRSAEVSSFYELSDCYICGIAPFTASCVAILAYLIEDGDQVCCPELRIINRIDGEDLSSETLPIKSFELNQPIDYNLASNPDNVTGVENKPILYIVSPKDVVVAQPRQIDDHIEWALMQDDFHGALEIAQLHDDVQDPMVMFSIRGLQDKLLGYLLQNNEYEEAASLCVEYLNEDKDRWVQWATKFENYEMLGSLATSLPIRNPQLPPEVYESVLLELMTKKEYSGLVSIIRRWQTLLYQHSKAQMLSKHMDEEPLMKVAPLYRKKTLMERINGALCELGDSGTSVNLLKDTLAELYVSDGQYDMALREYLDRSPEGKTHERADLVFGLIEKHGLLNSVRDKVRQLVQLDVDRTVTLFVNSVVSQGLLEDPSGYIQIADIVHQLGGRATSSKTDLRPLLKFLHDLFRRRQEEYNNEHMSEYQDMQVQLYARYDPGSLKDFLEMATFYSLEKALKVCESTNGLYEETVFVLGRMGGATNIQRALRIILEQLRSVPLAIAFVEREGDSLLWNDLVQRCVSDAGLVGDLLLEVGSHSVDPVHLIQSMSNDMKVHELTIKIETLFRDVGLQSKIREGCNSVMRVDLVTMLEELRAKRQKAVSVQTSRTCGICKYPLNSASNAPKLVLFGSGHGYHYECIYKAAVCSETVRSDANGVIKLRHKHVVLFSKQLEDFEDTT